MNHTPDKNSFESSDQWIDQPNPLEPPLYLTASNCTDCTNADFFWQPTGITNEQCFSECLIADLSCYGTTDSWTAECPPATYTGYLREIEVSFCMDNNIEYYLDYENGEWAFNLHDPDDLITDLHINRFVSIELDGEYTGGECTAQIITNIEISDQCQNPVLCFADPCEVTTQCELKTSAECTANYCSGCYADFYDLDNNLVDCNGSGTQECDDLAEVDFGLCDMYMGVAVLDGACSAVSGCGWVIDGIDYSDAFVDSMEECQQNCMTEPNSCDEIADTYDQLFNEQNTFCEVDSDCIAIWGDCDVGLGGCHYALHSNDYVQEDIDQLVNEWTQQNCTAGACDCVGLPPAICSANNQCELAYCPEPNPAGCMQTGCAEGFECLDYETTNDCVASSCYCDAVWGNWFCTEDCNGGTCSGPGDINYDADVNIQDIVVLINFILGTENPTSGESIAADYNGDGNLDVLDVVSLVNLILIPLTYNEEDVDEQAIW